MNNAERAELVAYKISRAKETLAEVDTHIKNKVLHTAVNRVYYACFYAVSALLIDKEIKARKHSGVKQMFGLHFIVPGIIDAESGEFYTTIFEMRQSGDYEDFIYFTEDEVTALLAPAGKLITRIEEILLEK
jgi:uncharacterized protein (UPF0332 family)